VRDKKSLEALFNNASRDFHYWSNQALQRLNIGQKLYKIQLMWYNQVVTLSSLIEKIEENVGFAKDNVRL